MVFLYIYTNVKTGVMIERIKQIITAKQMTSSGFADIVGVPRSTISHVLSGRNNPSLELVQKIMDAFPDIRTQWLIRGEGNMSDQLQDLFSQPEGIEDRPVKKSRVIVESTEKQPVKVLILYDDGTFSSYMPDDINR